MNSKIKVFEASLLFVFLAGGAALGQQASPNQSSEDTGPVIVSERTIVSRPGAAITVGDGWRMDGEEQLPAKCVNASTDQENQPNSYSQFYRVDTKESMNKALQVSASASGKYYGAQGSAAYSAAKDEQLLGDTVYIAGYQVVQTKVESAVPPENETSCSLSPDYSNKAEGTMAAVKITCDELKYLLSKYDGDHDQFFKDCGDSYVSSVTYGGYQTGILYMATRNWSEYQAVSASLGGGFDLGLIGGAAQVGLNSYVKQFSKDNRLNISEYNTGQLLDSPITIDTFLSNYQAFVHRFSAAPTGESETPVLVTLRRYDLLTSWPRTMKFPSKWQNGVLLQQEGNALNDLLKTIQWIRGNMAKQQLDLDVTEASLLSAEGQVQAEQNKVESQHNSCVADPANCSIDGLWTDDYAQRASLPVLKNELSSEQIHETRLTAIKSLQAEILTQGNGNPNTNDCPKYNGRHKQLRGRAGNPCHWDWEDITATEKADEGSEPVIQQDSVNYRVDKWLQSANRARCSDQQIEWGCVPPHVIESYRVMLLKKNNLLTNQTADVTAR